MALAMNDKTLMEAVGAESGSARLVKQVAMVVLGIAALAIGLSASLLIRFPETMSSTTASTAPPDLPSRSVGQALKSRPFCQALIIGFHRAVGATRHINRKPPV